MKGDLNLASIQAEDLSIQFKSFGSEKGGLMLMLIMVMIIMIMTTIMMMLMRMKTICDVINKKQNKSKGGNDYVDRAGYCTK